MLIGQHIGPFEIEKELGSGAMGTVYRATFQRNEEKAVPVALKVIALGLLGNQGAMARFEREANILKQLKHPHIVRLIAHGKINKSNPYIAMEFIDGEALDRVLARRGKMSWEEAVAYGRQLCEALQYAHEKGIIHRDLKPSNLMITRDGTLKLTDFGIAKDSDVTALTGANSTIGTAAYMSPEQCKGDRNLSNKSDLYSLGVVFFELITGRKPFSADTTVEMFLKHVNEKPPRIGKLVNELPTKFESLILQLLEKDIDDRPIDAAWVGRMLGEVEEDAFMRKSAGLAIAEARTAKPHNQSGDKMDATDKEAARALRGGSKKKKAKKPVAVPFWEQKGVRAVGILAALALMAVGVYMMMKPSSPAKLFAAIEKAEPDEKANAAAKFLDAYGDKGGDMVDQAAAIYRAARVRERERQLTNRYEDRRLRKPADADDPEAFDGAMLAIEAERTGDFSLAEKTWEKVGTRFPDEAKLPYTTKEDQLARALWGWVADKRIQDVKAARAELAKLEQKIRDNKQYELPAKYDPISPESLAMRAMRFRDFGDAERTSRECDTLLRLTEKEPDKRAWNLLGCYIKRLLKVSGDPVAARMLRIEKRLADASTKANVLKNDPNNHVERRNVRNNCREIIELYEDDPEFVVKEAVKRATAIAALVPPPAR